MYQHVPAHGKDGVIARGLNGPACPGLTDTVGDTSAVLFMALLQKVVQVSSIKIICSGVGSSNSMTH